MLDAYEKEQQLQTHIIERELVRCPADDLTQLQAIADHAAEVAHTVLLPYHFGAIAGFHNCIVYANMGPNNRQRLLDSLRQQLRHDGVRELACGIWPKEGEKDAGYTFAVVIDSPDVDFWEEILREVF